uniref:NUC173 domain-containing protein n=1 Tax=Caenorhabditis tropicalis TaxID=1561998 RepID=A0A1I7UNK1_9PELO
MAHFQEGAELFQAATNGVKTLLEVKKNKEVITESFVEGIVQSIGDYEMNYSYPQQQTAGAAIVVSARILLPETTMEEKLALIPLFRQGLDMISSFDKLPSFLWSNALPLFHTYLDNVPEDTPGAMKFLELLLRILEILKLSPKVNSDFFAYRSALSIARIITVTMELISNQEKDMEVREPALELLSKIVEQCPPENAPSVSLFVSGLLSKLAKFMQNQKIRPNFLQKACALFTEAVVLVFADNAIKFDIKKVDLNRINPEMRFIFLNQTEKWRTDGADSIVEFIHEITIRYITHRMWNVKKQVYTMVIRIQEACPQLFGERLYHHLLFIYKISRFNEVETFQFFGEKCLSLVKNEHKTREYFYEHLEAHIRSLPSKTRRSDGTEEIGIICALLSGIGEGVRLMCTTGSETIELLLRSLADSIVIDRQKILITRNGVPDELEIALTRMDLKYDLCHSNIKELCEILATFGGIEVVDMVHNLMRIESVAKRSSYHIILGYLLLALDVEKTSSDEPIILMLAEYMVKETNRLCVVNVIDDMKPVMNRYEIDWETCVESLSLINLTSCMKFIEKTANRSNISVNSLCTLLMQTTSASWIVSEAAECSLDILVKQDKSAKDVEDLIEIYSSHILNRLSMSCASSSDYHMAPILLTGYLSFAQVSKQFDVVRVIIEKMLFALDHNEQRYSYALLQAISVFVIKLNEEYPNQEPLPPPEDSEDGKPLPTPQHLIVEKILLRTKHMLLSEWLPVTVTVIKVISQGLEFVRRHDDILLPMIHQSWFGLMSLVKDFDSVTLPLSLDLIMKMAMMSGTFIHNKVLKELWPLVGDYFLTNAARKDEFQNTVDNINTLKMILSLPRIIVYSGLTEEEANGSFMRILKVAIEAKGPFYRDAMNENNRMIEFFKRETRRTQGTSTNQN